MADEVMPHEVAVRTWLARSRVAREDAEDLIQEAYCRLAMLDGVDHIDRGDAYFFSVVRNLLVRRLKRERVVSIETIAEIESRVDLTPSPEQQVGDRLDLARLTSFMASLPERRRAIVHLRKVEGWSQKRIAEHFAMTESAVEKQVWLGVKAIRRWWSDANEEAVAGRSVPVESRQSL